MGATRPGGVDQRPEVARRRLEAQIAGERYLDPLTGMPRLATMLDVWANRLGGPPVAVVLVAYDYGSFARRSGHTAAERRRGRLGSALRPLVAAARADVAVGADGRFVVVGPEPDGRRGVLAAEVRRRVAAVTTGVRPAAGVSVSAGRAASTAHAARMLRPRAHQLEPGRTEGALLCRPVVATMSGRVRGLHVGALPGRPAEAPRRAEDVVAAAADAAARWPDAFGRAVETVWVDVAAHEAVSPRLHEVVRDAWLARGVTSRVGLRVHPDGVGDLDDVPGLRLLASRGVRFALAGLSTGLPDPAAVDRTVFSELVVDAALLAGAAVEPDDAALAAGLVALASHQGMLTTADGVDDDAGIEVAARLGVWRVLGAALGPDRTLADAPAAWPAGGDLRSAPPASPVPAAGPPPFLPGRRTGWSGAAERAVQDRVRAWLDAATTPAQMRRLLGADGPGPRWTLADVSRLVARASDPGDDDDPGAPARAGEDA